MAMADLLHGSRQRPRPLRIAESLDAPMEKPTEAAVEGLCPSGDGIGYKKPEKTRGFSLHLGYIILVNVTIYSSTMDSSWVMANDGLGLVFIPNHHGKRWEP